MNQMPIESRSIHPRVEGRRTVHDKVDTSRPHKGGGKLAKKQAKLNKRQIEHAAILRRLPSNTNPNAFRMPGSMKK
jgi:hypothetical protein